MATSEDCPCGSRGLYGVCDNCSPVSKPGRVWAELYERAAFTPRAELVKRLEWLDSLFTLDVEAVWRELGFHARFPGRTKAIDRIRRRILDRHDTYVRVNL